MNNSHFERLYFSNIFQSRLVLKVVDEADLIYCWGLALSGRIKNIKSLQISQDRTAFRPSYGNLVERFLATESVPTLLMSATCPPRHFDQILASLKITRDYIDILRGELVRPEIRFIRIKINHGRSSMECLKTFFGTRTLISDAELVPTLVYCHTQNDTYLALKAINSARGNDSDSCNGLSTCVRRYHASTCPIDKLRRAQDFGSAKFAVMTCTNALGLGQNWTRVRRVIIMGQLDPMEVLQMAGRGGRDGRPSIAFLIVNHVAQTDCNALWSLRDQTEQDNDQQMHAMSVTDVCLRVAFEVLLRCVVHVITSLVPAITAVIV